MVSTVTRARTRVRAVAAPAACHRRAHRLAGVRLATALASALSIAGALTLSSAGVACGQQMVRISPSLGVSEAYDDNIRLSARNPESDFISVLTPGLRLQIDEQPWSATLDGQLRAEYFARQTELNNYTDNWNGNATVAFRPTQLLTFSLADKFARSLEASAIDPQTGLILGRFPSTTNTLTSSVSYQLDRLTETTAQYSLAVFRSESPSALDSDTHTAEVFVKRQLEILPRDSVSFRYTYTRFEFAETGTQQSHLPKLGLIHAFSPTLRVSGEAGPVFLEQSDGTTERDIGARGRYEQEFKTGSFSLTYERSPQLAGRIGEAGIGWSLTSATTYRFSESFSMHEGSAYSQTTTGDSSTLRSFTTQAGLDYELRRDMTVGASLMAIDTRSDAGATTTTGGTASGAGATATNFRTYSIDVRFNYRILRWLTLETSYRYFRQDDRSGSNDLQHNVFTVGLTASDQFRASELLSFLPF